MRRLGAIAVIGLALAGCVDTGAASDGFTLREYAIEVPSTRIEAGRVPLSIVNTGTFSHTMVVTDDAGRAIAATATIAPGEPVQLVVDLVPGTYHVSCRIVVQLPDGTIVDHYQAGMVARFEVDGP